MNRIAAALMIFGAGVAFNGGMLADALGRESVPPPAAAAGPVALSPTPLLSLLIVLEGLRQAGPGTDSPKV
jgi:hypothetical protein